jgi:hypothetical protein
MNERLSEQIAASIASIDANPEPTALQLVVVRETYRELLLQLQDFARDYEKSRPIANGRIHVWRAAGIASRLYQWLRAGRRRPIAGMGDNVVAIGRRA